MARDYNPCVFVQAFQMAGIEGESVYFVIEGYQIIDDIFMSMISSLLCSGEVPGLYSPEELESIISQLRDVSSQDGFSGSTASYFAERGFFKYTLAE